MDSFSRRDILKTFGLTAGGLSFLNSDAFAENPNDEPIEIPHDDRYVPLEKAVTAIVLGAGNRGNVYGRFALAFKNQIYIVGVAEPNPVRKYKNSTAHKI